MTKPTTEFSARWHLGLGLGGLALLIFGFGGWASFSEISGAVIAPGQIEVDQNRRWCSTQMAVSWPKFWPKKATPCAKGSC